MRLASGLVIGAIGVALLGYWLYDPLPDFVSDRQALLIQGGVIKLVMTVGRALEFLQLGNSDTLMKSVAGAMLRAPQNTSSVAFTYRMFSKSKTLIATPTAVAVATAAPDSGRPAVIYIHGGGWVFGAPEMYSDVFAQLVEKTGVVVFAVRYRLAPEHRFPAAFDDCLAAVEAIFSAAEASGVDPGRIAIAGDSAGGQLAASVVQQLRRAGSGFRPKLQVLVYPVTQVANLRTESYQTKSGTPLMRMLQMHSFISQYLTGSRAAAALINRHGHVTDAVKSMYQKSTGEAIPGASAEGIRDPRSSKLASLATDFRVSPLLGDGLEKLDLPPAHVLASEFDPLLDDAVLYAKRLERAGVRTHFRRFQTFHGAMAMPKDGQEIRAYLELVCKTL